MTSSHMWGNWNLPKFLLRAGTLSLMCMASLMILLMLCAHYGEGVNNGVMTCAVGMVIDVESGPRCSLSLPKRSLQIPCVLLITIQSVTLVPIGYSTVFVWCFAYPWDQQEVLDGVAFFAMDLEPTLPKMFLTFHLNSYCRVPPYTYCCGGGSCIVVVVDFFCLVDAVFMVAFDLESI